MNRGKCEGIGEEDVEGGTVRDEGRKRFGDVVEERDGIGRGSGDFGERVEDRIGEAREIGGGMSDGVERFLGVF